MTDAAIEAGFSKQQAEICGRMMVIYMMGETTLIPESMAMRSMPR